MSDNDICELFHPMFASLGKISFRRAEADGAPVMVVALGDKTAALPLRSVQREFNIPDDSADGRMLGLIAESLDYVTGLQPGDRLPTEVLSGEASWDAQDKHRRRARGRLRLQLLALAMPADATCSANTGTKDTVGDILERDPALQETMQRALELAARQTDAADAEEVTARIDALVHELSYIEALRDSLPDRMLVMLAQLRALTLLPHVGTARIETLSQTLRLGQAAIAQTLDRFEEIDAQSGEILATLRNHEGQRAFIRSSRDTLYRNHRAWDPVLTAWVDYAQAQIPGGQTMADDRVWRLVTKSYQFLAPRFMTFTEWHSVFTARATRGSAKLPNTMVW